MIFVAFEIPLTATGTFDGVFVPLPSWPKPLSPQHFTVESLRSAHVCALPASTIVAFVIPTTAVGVFADTFVPLPSCRSCRTPSTRLDRHSIRHRSEGFLR